MTACSLSELAAIATISQNIAPPVDFREKNWPGLKLVSAYNRRPACWQTQSLREISMQLIEQLESRRLLASFTAASVADLIADINAANAAGGSNTINLAAGSTFKLTAVDNNNYGPNGLPVIASGDNLTILGN